MASLEAALIELRAIARERRDKLIAKITADYEDTIARIAILEQDFKGIKTTEYRSIIACVSNALPTDSPFTTSDILSSLTALDPKRPWRKRSIEHCISKLRSKGIVKRLSKARNGSKHGRKSAIYIRSDVPHEPQPFEGMPLADAIYTVLTGRVMMATEIAVALSEAGYHTTMDPIPFRSHVSKSLHADRRFKRVGDKWTC